MINCYLTDAKPTICPGKGCHGKVISVRLNLRFKSSKETIPVSIYKCSKCGEYIISKGQFHAVPKVFKPYPKEKYEDAPVDIVDEKKEAKKSVNPEKFESVEYKGKKYKIIILPKSKPLSVCPQCKANTELLGVHSEKKPERKIYFQKCEKCGISCIREDNFSAGVSILREINEEIKNQKNKTSKKKQDKNVSECKSIDPSDKAEGVSTEMSGIDIYIPKDSVPKHVNIDYKKYFAKDLGDAKYIDDFGKIFDFSELKEKLYI